MDGLDSASHSHFLDVASEEVACTSGVLLSDANIRRLAGRYHISELRGITRTEHETVLRAEELEEAILNLRVAIIVNDAVSSRTSESTLRRPCSRAS